MDNAEAFELRNAKKFFKVFLQAASPSILSGFVNSLRSSFVRLLYGTTYGLVSYVKRYSSLEIYKYVERFNLYSISVNNSDADV